MKKDETNRERFVRIAESRTQKIIDMLELLGNCSNPYSYEYTQKDVDKMYGAIEAALKESKARYNEPKKKDSKFKFQDGVTEWIKSSCYTIYLMLKAP